MSKDLKKELESLNRYDIMAVSAWGHVQLDVLKDDISGEWIKFKDIQRIIKNIKED